jgi:hypothetical protein
MDQALKSDTGSSATSKWVISAGGTSVDEGISIAVDGSGNIYLTGCFKGMANFGSTTLTSKGILDIFVAKMDKSGKFLWAISAGGASDDYGISIAVDGSGNSYLTGEFEGTATFGSTTLTSNGGNDIFVAKVDKSGKFVWVASAGGTGEDKGLSIAMNGSGNFYITGAFSTTATIGDTTLTSIGNTDIFVAKVDMSGKFVWAASAGGTGEDEGLSIAMNGPGNFYITGGYQDAATFGSTAIISRGDDDIFVAKLDKSGKF